MALRSIYTKAHKLCGCYCATRSTSDIHSLRRLAVYEATRDQPLADQFAHLCCFELPTRQIEPGADVCLRLTLPKVDNLLASTLRGLSTHSPSVGTFNSVKPVINAGKPAAYDFYVDLNIFKRSVISTVISKDGGHGVDSDLHTWRLDAGGRVIKRQSQTIAIDFSSPNIAKPFHAGHLRSTMIGNYIANILAALGDKVTRINYLGDWGRQFGLVTAGYRLYGDKEQLEINAIQHLYELYVKMNKSVSTDAHLLEEAEKICTDLEQGDAEVTELWKTIRKASVDNYTRVYQRLGVSFDVHEWESEQHKGAKVLCADLLESGQLCKHEPDGACSVTFPVGTQGERQVIMLKSSGDTLYISRDVAAFLSRYEKYKFDRMLYVIEEGQHRHVSNIGHIVDHLGLMSKYGGQSSADSLIEHVRFGRVSGMSTRKGTAVLLSDILEEAKHRMVVKMTQSRTTKSTGAELERVAECLSTCAVIISDLRLSRVKGYTFSWDQVLSFNGDTGPMLQITHARLCSLVQNCGVDLNPSACLDSLVEPEAIRLITHLAKYDEAISRSAVQLEPHVLVLYLVNMCRLSNAAFKRLRVKDEETSRAEARLLMFHCARLTLANGLKYLGIYPLDSI